MPEDTVAYKVLHDVFAFLKSSRDSVATNVKNWNLLFSKYFGNSNTID